MGNRLAADGNHRGLDENPLSVDSWPRWYAHTSLMKRTAAIAMMVFVTESDLAVARSRTWRVEN